jgi:hypothetical protein
MLPSNHRLLIAHPGHELLLHGWIQRTRPVVHVLTDGSGGGSTGRLERTAEYLHESAATPGAIFGRFSDHQAYEMILSGNVELLFSVVSALAVELKAEQPDWLVTDAAEGYNPVHDLCRLIAGAAIELAEVATHHYEYPVVGGPLSYGSASAEVLVADLDDTAWTAKIAQAQSRAGLLPDIAGLLSLYGANAFRREAFRRVTDWTAIDCDTPPLYEKFGTERVAASRYGQVIRRADHLVPLRDELRIRVGTPSCAF